MTTRRTKIAEPEELRRLIPIVEAKLATLPAIVTGRLASYEARRAAVDRALAELRSEVGARVKNVRWGVCSLRIAGIAVTCTAGGAGAMRNWLTRAERQLVTSAGRAA